MPIIGFKKQFAEPIKNGTKTQTIRPIGKRQYKVGDKLYAYSGLRTKSCHKLGEFIIDRVDKVYFDENNFYSPIYNGVQLMGPEKAGFAHDDGFKDWQTMHDWFYKQYGDDLKDMDFQLIAWGDTLN